MAETTPASHSQLTLDSVIQILLRVEKDVAKVDEKVTNLDQKVDTKERDLDTKVDSLTEQKGKIFGGLSIVRWVGGSLFGVVFAVGLSGGSYILGTETSHLERIVTLEANAKNESERLKDFRTDYSTKLNSVAQDSGQVPQLREEVATLIKSVSDLSSEATHVKNDSTGVREDLDKLTNKVRGIDDDVTVLKERPSSTKK